MSIHYQDEHVTLYHGDCLEQLAALPDASVDAVVTDPPYGLSNTTPEQVAETITRWVSGDREYLPTARGFMGHEWDGFVPPVAVWDECLRVLKPGGHLLAFAGSRTQDLMGLAVRLAGFEIRDSVAWLYGSGFPKSMDVSKALDRIAGADRGTPRSHSSGGKFGFAGRNINGAEDSTWRCEACGRSRGSQPGNCQCDTRGEPQTDAARQWQGWGTALKPSHEPVVVARKPHVIGGILDGIGSELTRLEDECRRSVSVAARSSAPTPADSPEARTATALDSAATPHEDGQGPTTPTGAAVGSSARTATSWSGEETPTPSSTVSSWRNCWVELCELTSTSTTSTTTGPTTDLQTLWSSISSLTVTSTPDSPTPALTSGSTASAVDSLFAATVLRLRATLALSATESATASTPQAPQGAGGRSAFEPIILARKPLDGTVAANVLEHGTGALNIDGCRVGTEPTVRTNRAEMGYHGGNLSSEYTTGSSQGRWPANVVLDESQAEELDRQAPVAGSWSPAGKSYAGSPSTGSHLGGLHAQGSAHYGDSGGASRFFYVAKAPKSERPVVDGTAHPTVKPLALMEWLVRMVTPPGGTVLDPFAGSGTTLEAAVREGFNCIGIERQDEYLPLIHHRIQRAKQDHIEASAQGVLPIPTREDQP